jgi:hypothetical protein
VIEPDSNVTMLGCSDPFDEALRRTRNNTICNRALAPKDVVAILSILLHEANEMALSLVRDATDGGIG